MINPKELAKTSLILLEEAVLATLFIEQQGLRRGEISNWLGIKNENYSYRDRSYPIIASVLNNLEREGRVEHDGSQSARKWKLTESERKERHKYLHSTKL